jgi:hypothetical protein
MGARRGAREAPTPLQSKIGRGRRRDWKGAELRFDRKKNQDWKGPSIYERRRNLEIGVGMARRICRAGDLRSPRGTLAGGRNGKAQDFHRRRILDETLPLSTECRPVNKILVTGASSCRQDEMLPLSLHQSSAMSPKMPVADY